MGRKIEYISQLCLLWFDGHSSVVLCLLYGLWYACFHLILCFHCLEDQLAGLRVCPQQDPLCFCRQTFDRIKKLNLQIYHTRTMALSVTVSLFQKLELMIKNMEFLYYGNATHDTHSNYFPSYTAPITSCKIHIFAPPQTFAHDVFLVTEYTQWQAHSCKKNRQLSHHQDTRTEHWQEDH